MSPLLIFSRVGVSGFADKELQLVELSWETFLFVQQRRSDTVHRQDGEPLQDHGKTGHDEIHGDARRNGPRAAAKVDGDGAEQVGVDTPTRS